MPERKEGVLKNCVIQMQDGGEVRNVVLIDSVIDAETFRPMNCRIVNVVVNRTGRKEEG